MVTAALRRSPPWVERGARLPPWCFATAFPPSLAKSVTVSNLDLRAATFAEETYHAESLPLGGGDADAQKEGCRIMSAKRMTRRWPPPNLPNGQPRQS